MLGKGSSNIRKESACMCVCLLLCVAVCMRDVCPRKWECVSLVHVCILYVFLLCFSYVFVSECMPIFVCVCVCVCACVCACVHVYV